MAHDNHLPVKALQKQREALLEPINEKAFALGFAIQTTPVGLMILPIRDGQPLSEEAFRSLSPEEREDLLQTRDKLQAEMEAAFRQAKRLEKASCPWQCGRRQW